MIELKFPHIEGSLDLTAEPTGESYHKVFSDRVEITFPDGTIAVITRPEIVSIFHIMEAQFHVKRAKGKIVEP